MDNQFQSIGGKDKDPYSIFEYLIKKLEYRKLSMNKTRAAVNNIANIQDLNENKRYMNIHFSEIEDDVKQATEALKILLSKNKDFAEQVFIMSKRYEQGEVVLQVEKREKAGISLQVEALYRELDDYKQLVANKDSIVTYSNEKILLLDRELKERADKVEELTILGDEQKQKIEILSEEIRILKLENQRLKEEHSKQSERTFENSGNNKNSIQNILYEREQAKKMINEKIKHHLFENIHEPNKSPHSTASNKFSPNHSDRLPNLIARITESSDNINYLNSKLGKDFMTKLLSDNVDEIFLKNISDVLDKKEADSQRAVKSKADYVFDDDYSDLNTVTKRNLIYEEAAAVNNTTESYAHQYKPSVYETPEIVEEKEEEYEVSGSNFAPRLKETNRSNTNTDRLNRSANRSLNRSTDSKKSLTRSYSSSVINNKSFANSLRSYNTSKAGHRKQFVNYTTPYGNYFDEQLQRGGSSKHGKSVKFSANSNQ